MNRGEPLRIIIVGVRILPFRHAGDKNFWLDIIQRLLASGHEGEALSVDLEATPTDGLPIRHVPQIPVYFRPDARFNPGHRAYGGVNNYASKTTTLPIIAREVRRRQRAFRPDVIHFADNFGPGMIGLRPLFGHVPLTVSAPTYHRNRPLYDVMLLASFASFDVIVPFSDAYYRRLLEPGTFVVLWTGFTQQTSEGDLHSAIRTAQLVLQDRRAEFVFCFKPEHFRDEFRSFERPGLKVVSSAEMFHAARTAADVFLSPIEDARSTAAPPLVWPEILAMGIPILTTSIPGTDEAVIEGESGFAIRSPEEARERLVEIAADPTLQRRLREGARRIAVDRFSVDRATDEYVDMWSALLHQSR